jgi:N-acylglucosamine 2-epimerase
MEKNSQKFFDRFLSLHDFTQKHFFDKEYGEWYAELYRDGSPKLTDKGTIWKACYHLPRAILMLTKLFERY